MQWRNFLIIFRALLLVKVLLGAENQLQIFTLHKEEDCSDSGEVYTKSVRNLARVSSLVTCGSMRCFCNHHGLWSFTTYKNFKRSLQEPLKSGNSLLEVKGKTCESRKLNWGFLQLRSLRHVGNADTSIRTLSLFTDEGFLGLDLQLTGSRLSLPSPIEFRSWGFTGGKAWAVFPMRNFKGNLTCLRASSRTSLIGHQNSNFSGPIGSIYSSCPKSGNVPSPSNSLTLYTTPTGNSTNEADDSLFLDGSELRLSQPQVFVEYSITGGDRWTIYAGLEFNGKSRCLATFGSWQVKNGSSQRRFRFKRNSFDSTDSLDFGETWLIGSVRRGCFLSSIAQYEEDYDDSVFHFYGVVAGNNGKEKNMTDWNSTAGNESSGIPTSSGKGIPLMPIGATVIILSFLLVGLTN